MRLALMLKTYLSVHKLTSKAVAKEIGVGPSTLSRFMGGKGMPDAESLIRIQARCLAPEKVQPQRTIEELVS